jgi:hypothetical protein
MERSALDLGLTVFAGPAPKIRTLVLFGHIGSLSRGPLGHSSEFLVLCRDESGLPPPWISKAGLTDQEIRRLESLLRETGFPGRVPRVVFHKGPLAGGGVYGGLDVGLDGRRVSWNFLSEGAGFSGEDADPFGALLQYLGELAEAGGRPAFRAVMSRLVRRRANEAIGLIERRPEMCRR